MATQETVIVEINVQESLTQLATLNQELQELTKMRKDLAEASKKGDLEATKQLEGLNSVIRQTQEEYKAQQRVVDGYVKAKKLEVDTTNLNNNSINANRALLKQLTAQYNDLKNPSKEATDLIKRLSDTLKQQESAIGDNRRSVGSYRESIVAAAKDLNVFGVNVGGVVSHIADAKDAFKDAGGGAEGLGAGLTKLSGGPFFLVITAVSVLQSAIEKLVFVIDNAEDVTGGFSNAYDALVGALNAGIFSTDVSKVNWDEFTKSIEAAYEEGVKFTQQQRELNEETERQAIYNANASKSIDALLLKSRDRTKDAKERIGFLDEASKLEQENLEKQLKLATEQEQLYAKQLGLAMVRGIDEDEIRKKAYAAAVARINLERESILLQEKITIRRNALLDQEAERLKKIEEDRQKAFAAEQKRLEDLANSRRAAELEFNRVQGELNVQGLDFLTDAAKRRVAVFEIEFENRRTSLRNAGVSELTITKLYEEEKTKVIQEEVNKQNAIVQSGVTQNKAALELLKSNATQQLELQKLFNQSQAEIDQEFADSNYATFKDYYDAKKKLYAEDAAAQKTAAQQAKDAAAAAAAELKNNINLAITVANGILSIVDMVSQAQQAAADAEIERDRATLDQKKELLQEQYDNGLISKQKFDAETLKLDKAFNAKSAAIKKEQYEKDKAARIATAVINTAAAVVSALGTSGNIIAGVVLAALAAATGAAQIAIISSEPTPTFALGGDASGIEVGGKSHSEGGTVYRGSDGNVFEAERGEGIFVMKRNAYQDLHKLSSWNQAYGGNSWFGNGVNYAAQGGVITDGGFTVRDLSGNVDNAILMKNAMKEALREMPDFVVSVQEFNRVNNSSQRAAKVSSGG